MVSRIYIYIYIYGIPFRSQILLLAVGKITILGLKFTVVLIRRVPPLIKKSSGYTGRSKTSFAQATTGSDSTECCTKTKNLAMDSTPNAAELMQ